MKQTNVLLNLRLHPKYVTRSEHNFSKNQDILKTCNKMKSLNSVCAEWPFQKSWHFLTCIQLQFPSPAQLWLLAALAVTPYEMKKLSFLLCWDTQSASLSSYILHVKFSCRMEVLLHQNDLVFISGGPWRRPISVHYISHPLDIPLSHESYRVTTDQ